MPIQQALGKNLRHSLDLNRRKKNDYVVSFQRLEDVGLSLDQTMLAICFVIFSFALYYIAPTAWLYGNLYPFMMVLQFLVLSAIIGATFLSVQIQPFIEEFIAFIMLKMICCRD